MKSVFCGAVAGATLPFLMFSVPAAAEAVMAGRWAHLASIGGATLGFPAVFAPLSSLVIVLPIGWMLRTLKAENALNFTLAGAVVVSTVLAALLIREPDTYWIGLAGALSGAATGYTWWRSRP